MEVVGRLLLEQTDTRRRFTDTGEQGVDAADLSESQSSSRVPVAVEVEGCTIRISAPRLTIFTVGFI